MCKLGSSKFNGKNSQSSDEMFDWGVNKNIGVIYFYNVSFKRVKSDKWVRIRICRCRDKTIGLWM
jgi:hypothetical protein